MQKRSKFIDHENELCFYHDRPLFVSNGLCTTYTWKVKLDLDFHPGWNLVKYEIRKIFTGKAKEKFIQNASYSSFDHMPEEVKFIYSKKNNLKLMKTLKVAFLFYYLPCFPFVFDIKSTVLEENDLKQSLKLYRYRQKF